MPRLIPRTPPCSLRRLLPHPTARSLSFSAAATAEEGHTQKLERIANELLDLSKLERYNYSILFGLQLGLNWWGPTRPSLVPSSFSASRSTSNASKAATTEKTAFDIKLEKFEAAAKIKIIKEVRTFTDLGLKEAKDLVEKVPVVVKKQVTKEEAEQIATKLKEIGATVVLE